MLALNTQPVCTYIQVTCSVSWLCRENTVVMATGKWEHVHVQSGMYSMHSVDNFSEERRGRGAITLNHTIHDIRVHVHFMYNYCARLTFSQWLQSPDCLP